MIGVNLKTLVEQKYTLQEKKVMLIATFGAFIEFFDFTIFGFYSIYFGGQIFPEKDSLLSMITVYIVFTLGFLCKPLGILIADRLINKVNTKRILINTVLIMGVCSFSMGIIPSHHSIGIYAGILMTVARITQGLASGGEIRGMIRYINQNIPEKKLHNTISGILLGSELGGLAAIAINQILNHTMGHQYILSFGWRIPFFISGLMSILFYSYRFYFYRRYNTIITPISSKVFIDFLKQYRHQMIVLGSIVAINSTIWVTCIIYMPAILHHESELSYLDVSNIIFSATIYAICTSYLIIKLSRKLDPFKVLRTTLFLAIPAICLSHYFLLYKCHIQLAVCILIMIHCLLASFTPRIFRKHLFPARFRLSGIYMSVNLSYTLFGVLSPLVIISLTYLTHQYFIIHAVYATLITIISLIGLNSFKKMSQHE